jgi:hypothetical protein
MAKARLESLQQKEKQYRDLMNKLSGNGEKRYVTILTVYLRSIETDMLTYVHDDQHLFMHILLEMTCD